MVKTDWSALTRVVVGVEKDLLTSITTNMRLLPMRDGKGGDTIRSALFVDFDNIFLSLSDQDESLARTFATRPHQWLTWLENSLPFYPREPSGTLRRVLVRRCYLNPLEFGVFRPYFVRAAFETIDCPALTSSGKTSADVHMVLDVLELLDHETHFDEFVIMSADADFTPVLLKLRKRDRRTMILGVGDTSPAYRAASDLVITQDMLIEETLAPEARRDDGPGLVRGGKVDRTLRAECSELIRTYVRKAPGPVTMAVLAAHIRRLYPTVANGWEGFGSFKQYLAHLDLEDLTLSSITPGYVYDPTRHDPPTGLESLEREEIFREEEPALEGVARKVHDLTDTPYLLPQHFRVLFDGIAEEVNASGYNLTAVSKVVRDRCREQHLPIARQHVCFVLRGIAFAGHRFGETTETGPFLAERFFENTLNLCANAQVTLSDEEVRGLREWIVGDGDGTNPPEDAPGRPTDRREGSFGAGIDLPE